MGEAAEIMRELREVRRGQQELAAKLDRIAAPERTRWLSAKEVMGRLGVGRTVFYAEVRTRLGPRWRGKYDPERVESLLKSYQGNRR